MKNDFEHIFLINYLEKIISNAFIIADFSRFYIRNFKLAFSYFVDEETKKQFFFFEKFNFLTYVFFY